jgi:CRISPR-associated protein Cas5d
MAQRYTLEVWGDLACFTRPEMKVERYSYPVITPSAARGIFDAIHWHSVDGKPTFRWQVHKIEILTLPRYIALRRNEVKDKVPPAVTIGKWMDGTKEVSPLFADGDRETLGTDQKGRTQRQTMALKDVRYRLHGEIRPWPGFEREVAKADTMFARRADRGQCIYQPYLGCREFPAYFRLVKDPVAEPPPIPLDMNLGWMLYDVFDLSRPGSTTDSPRISLFQATIRNGTLEIPLYESSAVRKPPRREG